MRLSRRDYGDVESAVLEFSGPIRVSFDSEFDIEASSGGAHCPYDFLELTFSESSAKYCGTIPPEDFEVGKMDTLKVTWSTDGAVTKYGWSFDIYFLSSPPPPSPPSPPSPPPYAPAPPLEVVGNTAIISSEIYAEDNLVESINSSSINKVNLYVNIQLHSQLPNISKTLEIAGFCSERCVIDGNKAFQVLRVVQGGHLLLANVTVQNGAAELGGGVRLSGNSSAELRQCRLSDNAATSGGAVYISGGTLILTDTEIIQNSASYGGAISLENAMLSIEDCIVANSSAVRGGFLHGQTSGAVSLVRTALINNAATANGGGAFLMGAGETVMATSISLRMESCSVEGGWAEFGGVLRTSFHTLVEIEASVFLRNAASDTGGAIDSSQNDTYFITGSLFERNSAPLGGALEFAGRSFTLLASVARLNTAQYGGVAARSSDSFVPNNETSFALLSSVFEANSANFSAASSTDCAALQLTSEGGALRVSSGADDDSTLLSVLVDNCTFSENGGDHGGAVFLDAARGMTMTRTALVHNVAVRGAGVYVTGGAVVVLDSSLTANNATEAGGALFGVEGAQMLLEGCTVAANRQRAVHLEGGGMCTMVDTVLQHNYANRTAGGAVYLGAGGAVANLTNCTAQGNRADDHGGVIAANDGSVDIFDSWLEHNTVGKDGAVVLMHLGSVRLERCTVRQNHAGVNAGVVHGLGATVVITHSHLQGNTAMGTGGVVQLEGGRLTLADTEVTDSVAAFEAAAVYAMYDAVVVMERAWLARNSGGARAGLVISQHEIWLLHCVVEDNMGSLGLLYLDGDQSRLHMEDSVASRNTATGGGVVYCYMCGDLSFVRSNLTGNVASINGGVLMMEKGAGNMYMERTVVTGNVAWENGGVVYTTGAVLGPTTLVVSHSRVDGNVAFNNGGFVASATLPYINLSHSTIANNTAHADGSALHVRSSQIEATATSFVSNSADRGTVFFSSPGSLLLTRCVFSRNLAAHGNSLHLEGAQVTVQLRHCNISDNRGSLTGSIVARDGVAMEMDGCAVSRNRCEVSGGGVYLDGGAKLTARGSAFEGNLAFASGGGISVKGNSTLQLLEHSVLQDNQ
ncbi:hypothetical protein CYMTET_37997, partial [Cymbomonas tetramitiformis]